MSIALLDVNVLIALLDPHHIHMHAAHAWLGEHGRKPVASCPLTINGCIRVLTGARYPGGPATIEDVAQRLREFQKRAGHEYWPDDINVLDDGFDLIAMHGGHQLTDIYLLGLAVRHGGHLITFDRTIPWRAVKGAKASHLKILVS